MRIKTLFILALLLVFLQQASADCCIKLVKDQSGSVAAPLFNANSSVLQFSLADRGNVYLTGTEWIFSITSVQEKFNPPALGPEDSVLMYIYGLKRSITLQNADTGDALAIPPTTKIGFDYVARLDVKHTQKTYPLYEIVQDPQTGRRTRNIGSRTLKLGEVRFNARVNKEALGSLGGCNELARANRFVVQLFSTAGKQLSDRTNFDFSIDCASLGFGPPKFEISAVPFAKTFSTQNREQDLRIEFLPSIVSVLGQLSTEKSFDITITSRSGWWPFILNNAKEPTIQPDGSLATLLSINKSITQPADAFLTTHFYKPPYRPYWNQRARSFYWARSCGDDKLQIDVKGASGKDYGTTEVQFSIDCKTNAVLRLPSGYKALDHLPADIKPQSSLLTKTLEDYMDALADEGLSSRVEMDDLFDYNSIKQNKPKFVILLGDKAKRFERKLTPAQAVDLHGSGGADFVENDDAIDEVVGYQPATGRIPGGVNDVIQYLQYRPRKNVPAGADPALYRTTLAPIRQTRKIFADICGTRDFPTREGSTCYGGHAADELAFAVWGSGSLCEENNPNDCHFAPEYCELTEIRDPPTPYGRLIENRTCKQESLLQKESSESTLLIFSGHGTEDVVSGFVKDSVAGKTVRRESTISGEIEFKQDLKNAPLVFATGCFNAKPGGGLSKLILARGARAFIASVDRTYAETNFERIVEEIIEACKPDQKVPIGIAVQQAKAQEVNLLKSEKSAKAVDIDEGLIHVKEITLIGDPTISCS